MKKRASKRGRPRRPGTTKPEKIASWMLSKYRKGYTWHEFKTTWGFSRDSTARAYYSKAQEILRRWGFKDGEIGPLTCSLCPVFTPPRDLPITRAEWSEFVKKLTQPENAVFSKVFWIVISLIIEERERLFRAVSEILDKLKETE